MIGCAPRRRPTRSAAVAVAATTLLAASAAVPVVAETSGRVHRDGSKLGELMRAQTQACWSPPASAMQAGAARRIVRLRFTLGRDGGLASGPEIVDPSDDPDFKLLAASAIRAVKRCAPFKLPAASYDDWRDVDITFKPDIGL